VLCPTRTFKKTTFTAGTDVYELDAATYSSPNVIEAGIDVKRVEAKRDIHKRSDEIVNKANKFKDVYPSGKFGAVVYFPFDQGVMRSRLSSPKIDGLVFANDDDAVIEVAVRDLLGQMGVLSRP
jgi:hypothetical protein